MSTEHFADNEFNCNCGANKIRQDFIPFLEEIYKYLDKTTDGCGAIVVTSGYRCPECSVAVGGYCNDAHTCGFAADIIAYHKDKKSTYSSFEVAAVAEHLGFGGIGIIDSTACHVDKRDVYPYSNSHWFGDEKTGEYYTTFAGFLPRIVSRETFSSEIEIDNKRYIINLIEKSGD